MPCPPDRSFLAPYQDGTVREEQAITALQAAYAMHALEPLREETSARIICDALPVVHGEGALLTQLFQNLLANAMKFRRPEATPRCMWGCAATAGRPRCACATTTSASRRSTPTRSSTRSERRSVSVFPWEPPRERGTQIEVLLVEDDPGDVLRSYAAHANAYVTKPVDFERFIDAVRRIDDFFVSVVRLPRADSAAPYPSSVARRS